MMYLIIETNDGDQLYKSDNDLEKLAQKILEFPAETIVSWNISCPEPINYEDELFELV